jgi:lipopolysaccharide biosynthesis glycosyltransferase
MTSKTCIVLSTDEHFFEYAFVLLKSISANYSGKNALDVIVLVPSRLLDRESDFNVFSNLKVSFRYPSEIEKAVNNGAIDRLTKNTHFTEATFYRYFMASICKEFNKAIYIDVDCIVIRDIQPLLDFELIGAPLAAIQEIQLEFLGEDLKDFKDSAYFNSGVMVANLVYWRKHGIENKLLEESSRDDRVLPGFGDQDIFNIVFKNNWIPMSFNFNYLTSVYPNLKKYDPLVVHFPGPEKPWLPIGPDNEWKKLWRQYRRL